MPLFDNVKVYRDDVALLIEPGERLLAMGNFLQLSNADDSRLERTEDELSGLERRFLRGTGQRMPTSERWFQGIDWTGIHINPDRIDRVLSGLRGEGAVDSIGGRLWRLAKNKPEPLQWAVTDRRFLLLHRPDGPLKGFALYFELSRTLITSVRRRGKLIFQWGRVEMRFSDGSMFAFMTSLLDLSAARQFVRALSITG